jgi:hypothetical protein
MVRRDKSILEKSEAEKVLHFRSLIEQLLDMENFLTLGSLSTLEQLFRVLEEAIMLVSNRLDVEQLLLREENNNIIKPRNPSGEDPLYAESNPLITIRDTSDPVFFIDEWKELFLRLKNWIMGLRLMLRRDQPIQVDYLTHCADIYTYLNMLRNDSLPLIKKGGKLENILSSVLRKVNSNLATLRSGNRKPIRTLGQYPKNPEEQINVLRKEVITWKKKATFNPRKGSKNQKASKAKKTTRRSQK